MPFYRPSPAVSAALPNPTNGDVIAATIAVLGGLGVDPPLLLCDAAPTEEADHGPT